MSSFSVNEESELCSMINNFRRLGKSTKTCVTVKFPLTQKHYSKIRQEITETKHYDKQDQSSTAKEIFFLPHITTLIVIIQDIEENTEIIQEIKFKQGNSIMKFKSAFLSHLGVSFSLPTNLSRFSKIEREYGLQIEL